MTATSRLLLLCSLGVAALPVGAAVIHVGPGGVTLSEALTAAAAPGDDEIRIASGEHAVSVVIETTAADMLTISGGWDATYTTRTADPALSALDGGGEDRPIFVVGSAGRVEIHNLTVRNGRSFTGAGVEANLSGSAQLLLAELVIRDNLATWEFASNGGGLKIYAAGDALAEVVDCEIRGNRTRSTDSSTVGGGVYLGGAGNGQIVMTGTTIENNVAESPSSPNGGGILIDAFDQSLFEITRTTIRGNRLEGGDDNAGTGAGVYATFRQTSTLDFRAGKIVDNDDLSRPAGGPQAEITANDASTVKLGDSEISGGTGTGALLRAYDDGGINLVNLTVAGNPDGGVVLDRFSTANTTLFSSILWGNGGAELAGNFPPSSANRNLIEGTPGAANPLFAGAATGNYRLRAGSPAIDEGDATPDGGIGAIDADGGERRIGENVDQGAYEFGAFHVFFDGFEP